MMHAGIIWAELFIHFSIGSGDGLWSSVILEEMSRNEGILSLIV